jgi:hypothetical protein
MVLSQLARRSSTFPPLRPLAASIRLEMRPSAMAADTSPSALAAASAMELPVPLPRYTVNNAAAGGQRIKNLLYKDAPMSDTADFIIASNNYRANSSASFILGTGKAFNIVWAFPDANREVVLNYVRPRRTSPLQAMDQRAAGASPVRPRLARCYSSRVRIRWLWPRPRASLTSVSIAPTTQGSTPAMAAIASTLLI